VQLNMNMSIQMYRNLLAHPKILAIYDKLRRRYGDVEIIEIEIPRRTISGHIYIDKEYVGKNVLLNNFWSYFLGFLLDLNTPARDQQGLGYTLQTAGHPNVSPAVVCIGGSNVSESFAQYKLQGSFSCYSATITLGIDSSKNASIITISSGAGISGYETGVRQALQDTGNVTYYTFLSRKVLTISAGQIVTHKWILTMPWLLNTATLLWGLLGDENVAMTNINNAQFTAKTKYEANASGQRIILSESAISFTPSLTTLPNMISITTYNMFNRVDLVVYAIVLGIYIPDTDKTIQTIGMVQDIYDTGGAKHTVLTLAYPLPTPINAKAGKSYIFMIRIVGF